MVKLRFMLAMVCFTWWITATSVAIAAGDADAHPIKRVLVFYENESTLPAAMEVAQGLRIGLDQRFPTGIDIYAEYLDIVRFPAPEHMLRLATDLEAKYADVTFDVVMAVGPGALKFLLDNRSRIAPGVPLIFGAINDARLKDEQLPPGVGGVVSHFDVPKTIDLARQLQPNAKTVVVLTGSSEFDRGWAKISSKLLEAYRPKLRVEHLTGLTLEGFKERVQRLPPDTILLILSVFQDADGRRFIPRNAAAEIAVASSAPSYGVYSTYIGIGVLGGYVETFQSIGEDMATLAEQATNDSATPQLIRSTGQFLVDWRQMKRWGIDVELLPADADLRFFEPTVWEKYRLQILAMMGVIALQTATIGALIVQGRRRRRIELALDQERLELAHLSRTSQLGELSGAFAHELNQPLTSILANAEAGARLVDTKPVDTVELREIFSDIVADDKRAARIIAQLRQLMVKGETQLDQMDLNDAVAATVALASSELVARQTRLDFHSDHSELAVRGNLAQLQQVVLNLILNAAEAMSNLGPAERRISIRTRKCEDGFCELMVADRGPGLTAEMRENAFKPFVSTKAKGLGLGLAICRSIVQAHGGTLRFDEHKHDGARVILALPPL
ncbi:ATP-binding protein [Aminobacter sp. AP02]|uniref:sensor histidine kinase n=1 Tax=Aminobacter sp. AP02 TaxID=2135737 RepID=UPI000D79B5BE|nr:ATP-binding protein [Aminobacter sp. AP02]PWK65650.1 phospho-acceptor domain-containing protein [Aminobacter sp. AP02]